VTYVSADSLPPPEDYLGVLWACGPALTNTLTAADQALLQSYFDQAERFFSPAGASFRTCPRRLSFRTLCTRRRRAQPPLAFSTELIRCWRA